MTNVMMENERWEDSIQLLEPQPNEIYTLYIYTSVVINDLKKEQNNNMYTQCAK